MFRRRKPDEPEQTMENENDQKAGDARLDGDSAASNTGAATTAGADTGLGVPPFRPAAGTPVSNQTFQKDPSMARPPFPQPTANPPMPPSGGPPRPPAPPSTALRPPGAPERVAPAPERRTLVVGRGISVQGMVQDAERLVVEGTVEATMIHATELAVSPGGIFKGEVEVEDSEVAGTIDGTVTARGSLVVRSTGVVLGTARCRRLQVEDGGQITGRIEMLTDGSKRTTPTEREVLTT